MGRPKKIRSDDRAKPKYSIIVPEELDRKMEQVCQARQWNRSLLLREILENYLDRYLSETLGQILPDSELVIVLNEETKELLEVAATNLNLTPAAVVQLLITRNLPTIVEESRSQHQHMAALLGRTAEKISTKVTSPAAGRKKK